MYCYTNRTDSIRTETERMITQTADLEHKIQHVTSNLSIITGGVHDAYIYTAQTSLLQF